MRRIASAFGAILAFSATAGGATFTRSMERISTMDPAQGRSIYDARAHRLVYKSVLEVDYSARPYKIAPCACGLPEVSEDVLKEKESTPPRAAWEEGNDADDAVTPPTE